MCAVTPAASIRLEMDSQSPRRARQFVAQAHCDTHNAKVVDAAQLLVSELVTNAIRHGSPPITSEVECQDAEGMRVWVSDGSRASPILTDAHRDAESGRGIALVDLLSAEWGVEPHGDGKTVWFTVRP